MSVHSVGRIVSEHGNTVKTASTTAYLDIETSFSRSITIIGIHRPGQGTVQLVRPEATREKTLEALDGAERLVTFNGTCFDLPVIRGELGVDLKTRFDHFDLRYACARQGLKGGLKKIEFLLGIERDTEGVDGWAAMRLWEEWGRGSKESLDLLLRYNREDIENLPLLEAKIASRSLG
ncbi:MAG: ribonuclease H-like domain-containing protein [Elusimicrobia bacterium]|nr:ribonuclease H-like domain-containing protein [Elusimicrobiota bacterium]